MCKERQAEIARRKQVAAKAAAILDHFAHLGDQDKINIAFRLLLSKDGPIFLISSRKFLDANDRLEVVQDCCEWLLGRIVEWKDSGKTIHPGFLVVAIERWMFKYNMKRRTPIFRTDEPEGFEDGVKSAEKVFLRKRLVMAIETLGQKERNILLGCLLKEGTYDTGPNGSAARRRVLKKLADLVDDEMEHVYGK